MSKTVAIGNILNKSSGSFAQLLERAKKLRKLTYQLRAMVDAPLNEHIHVANIRDNKLIIGTDSAVWHTRIKYLAPTILEQMKEIQGLEKLQEIEFRVQPVASVGFQRDK